MATGKPPEQATSFEDSERFLAREAEFVRRLARSLLHESAEADDLAQEALLVALREPPRVLRRAWLRRVLQTRAINHLRSKRRIAPLDLPEEVEATASEPAALACVAETREALRHAVKRLEKHHRQVITLIYLEGLRPKEVASKLAIPLETVRTRRRVALARLRESLDRRPGGRAQWTSAFAFLLGKQRKSPSMGVFLGAAAFVVCSLAYRTSAPWNLERPSTIQPQPSTQPPSEAPLVGVGGDSREVGRFRKALNPPVDETSLNRNVLLQEEELPLVLRGRVTDEGGAPIAGARVFAFTDTDPEVFAVTDVRGEYAGAVPHGLLWIACWAYGHRTPLGRHRMDPAIAADETLDFRLARNTEEDVRGVVRDEQGQVVEGATVRLCRDLRNKRLFIQSRALLGPTVYPITRSDANGEFLLECSSPGAACLLIVEKQGYAPWSSSVRPGYGTMEPTLLRERVVSGTVLRGDGIAAAGAAVHLRGDGSRSVEVQADEHGRFLASGLPATRLNARAFLFDGERGWSAETSFDLASVTQAHWDARCVEGAVVSGRLQAVDGTPLSGWSVTASALPSENDGKLRRLVTPPTVLAHGTTGKDGNFTMYPIFEEQVHLLFENPRAGTEATFSERIVLDGRYHTTTAPESSGCISGRLAPPPAASPPTRLWIDSEHWARPLPVAVAPDGRCSITGLPAGTYQLIVWENGLAPREIGPWNIAEGEHLDVGDISDAAELHPLHVRVLDAAGLPVQVMVCLITGSPDPVDPRRVYIAQERADESGSASFQTTETRGIWLEVGGVNRAVFRQSVPPEAFDQPEELTVALPDVHPYDLSLQLPRDVETTDAWRLKVMDETGRTRIYQVRPYKMRPEQVAPFKLQMPNGTYEVWCEVGTRVRRFSALHLAGGRPARIALAFDSEGAW